MSDFVIDSDCQKFQYVRKVAVSESAKFGLFTVICQYPLIESNKSHQQSVKIIEQYAKNLGYADVALVSLFARKELSGDRPSTSFEPVGPENDLWIERVCRESDIIIAAWGDFPEVGKRSRDVLNLINDLDVFAIQLNRNATPTHPLGWKKKAPKVYRRAVSSALPSAG